MKNIFLFVSALVLFMTTSCQKEKASEGLTRITYYAEITLEGDAVVAIPLNGSYDEPGFSGTENEADKTSDVLVEDNIDASTLGVYTVSYALENADGFMSYATRTVVVYDPAAPADDFSGSYGVDGVRTEVDGSNPRSYPDGVMNITKVAPGIFHVDCIIGGIYSVGRGYGSGYAAPGYVQLHADNSITLLSGGAFPIWGDQLAIQNGIYDAVTGLTYWETLFIGDVFTVDAQAI